MPARDPAIRTLVAREGAHALHATHDSRELTRAAREAFNRRFEDAVDPERALPEAERARRVEHARKRYYTALARRSAQTRAARKEAGR